MSAQRASEEVKGKKRWEGDNWKASSMYAATQLIAKWGDIFECVKEFVEIVIFQVKLIPLHPYQFSIDT